MYNLFIIFLFYELCDSPEGHAEEDIEKVPHAEAEGDGHVDLSFVAQVVDAHVDLGILFVFNVRYLIEQGEDVLDTLNGHAVGNGGGGGVARGEDDIEPCHLDAEMLGKSAEDYSHNMGDKGNVFREGALFLFRLARLAVKLLLFLLLLLCFLFRKLFGLLFLVLFLFLQGELFFLLFLFGQHLFELFGRIIVDIHGFGLFLGKDLYF